MQQPSVRHRLESYILIGFILIVGALGQWVSHDMDPLQVDVSLIADLPTEIGLWESRNLSIDSMVERKLNADFNIQRIYLSPVSEPIWFYFGYYGTDRGGRPEHTPRGCYTGAGWGIESSQTITVDTSTGRSTNEYLVERDGERRLVHYWYRSHRRTGLLGGFDQSIDHLLGRLFDRRADGALVRLSTPIKDDDTTAARGRLLAFSVLIDPLLDEHWPIETPCETRDSTECANRFHSIREAAAVPLDFEGLLQQRRFTFAPLASRI